MAPPTFSHVIARSMRFPRKRAHEVIPSLFHSVRPPMGATGSDVKTTSARTTYLHPRHLSDKINENRLDRPTEKSLTRSVDGLSSSKLIRNGTDLLAFLRLAKKMQTWEEGLMAFLDATCTTLPSEVLVANGAVAGSHASSPPSASAPPDQRQRCHVTPTPAHITLLMDMCASRGQWVLVLFLVRHFGKTHPSLIVHAVTLMARHRVAPAALRKAVGVPETASSDHLRHKSPNQDTTLARSEVEVRGWHVACYYLHQLCSQLDYVPVEAFNVVLSSCRRDEDWLASMSVVRHMGPNPLQGWQSEKERTAIKRRFEGTKGTESALSKDWFCSFSTSAQPQVLVEPNTTLIPDSHLSESSAAAICTAELSECNAGPNTFGVPPPDVVSYATVIVTLEQAGEAQLATEVLNRLPPFEREKITASYAALICVWSNQLCRRKQR